MNDSRAPDAARKPQLPQVKRPSLPALALGLIPFIALCFTVTLWDRVNPMILGLPFNIFWPMLWMLLTPLCLWGAYRIERRREADDDQHRPKEERQ